MEKLNMIEQNNSINVDTVISPLEERKVNYYALLAAIITDEKDENGERIIIPEEDMLTEYRKTKKAIDKELESKLKLIKHKKVIHQEIENAKHEKDSSYKVQGFCPVKVEGDPDTIRRISAKINLNMNDIIIIPESQLVKDTYTEYSAAYKSADDVFLAMGVTRNYDKNKKQEVINDTQEVTR